MSSNVAWVKVAPSRRVNRSRIRPGQVGAKSRSFALATRCAPKQTCYHPSLAALGIIVSEWLSRTHQEWKLKLGMAWILAGIALFVIAIVAGALSVAWIVAVLAFCVAGFGWTALAIRCSACRRRVVYWVMLREPGHGWLNRMLKVDRCPVCGDSAAPRS